MLALQCMHDNLLKMHSFCWELHAKWYPSVKIEEKKSKLNMTSGGGAHLGHVGIAMYA